MSAILELATDEAFLLRMQNAILARCLLAPSETGDALLQRQRYNRAVLSKATLAAGEARRMVLPVLMNGTIQAGFTASGEPGIAQGDVEYVVEQQIAATLADMDVLIDPALAVTHAKTQSVLDDIAGSIAAYIITILREPAFQSSSNVYGTQLRRWATRNASTPTQLRDAAARLAVFVLADRETLESLSLHGIDALTANTLSTSVARVLPALVPWDLSA